MYTIIINTICNLVPGGVRKAWLFTASVKFVFAVARYLPRVFETYNENLVGLKLMHRKGFCTLDPCLPDTYRTHSYVPCAATIRFLCYFYALPYFIGVRHAFRPWGVSKK